LDKLSDEQVQQLSGAIALRLAGQRKERSPWDRRFSYISMAFGAASIIFSLGMNWTRVAANESRISETRTVVDKIEERVKVMETNIFEQRSDTRLINQKLDEIQRNMTEIKAKLR